MRSSLVIRRARSSSASMRNSSRSPRRNASAIRAGRSFSPGRTGWWRRFPTPEIRSATASRTTTGSTVTRSAGSQRPSAPTPRLQRPLHVALSFAFGDVTPLVALLLPACERELDLRAAVAEVELRRHEGQAALAYLAAERVELLAAKQKLSFAIRIVVLDIPLVVDGDVRADEPCFAVAHLGVRLL